MPRAYVCMKYQSTPPPPPPGVKTSTFCQICDVVVIVILSLHFNLKTTSGLLILMLYITPRRDIL